MTNSGAFEIQSPRFYGNVAAPIVQTTIADNYGIIDQNHRQFLPLCYFMTPEQIEQYGLTDFSERHRERR